MILVGLAAEAGAKVPLDRLVPTLELGFGGPLAGAGVLGPAFSLPIHYLHGVALGLLFVGIILLGERLGVAPPIPLWSSGMVFGGIVAGVVLFLLVETSTLTLTPGLVGLVCLLHVTFGGLAGFALQRCRVPFHVTNGQVLSVARK
jgi:hypothetical protein